MLRWFCGLAMAGALTAQPAYDLLLKGGRVIDPKNNINGVLDVAIAGGKIARVAANIPAAQAAKTVDVAGLLVTPGLIDIHAHVYVHPAAGKITLGVQADAFSFRSGVTTLADAGTSGARDFPDFRATQIDPSRTRVLAFLNISACGMDTPKENDPAEMDAEAAARTCLANADVIVGIKSAHYSGEGWHSIDNAVKAAAKAHIPVMVDFGRATAERNIRVLLGEKLRPGDIYTHCYSGLREELVDGKVNAAMRTGRERGIFFDVGFGAGSFFWNIAVPAYEQGFRPDSISTDVHTHSMNAGMKDMLNVMSEVMALGSSIEDVIRMSTCNPAREILRPALGNLDPGAEADVAVLRVDNGGFGLLDSAGARRAASQRLVCELTLRKGAVVWDLNGRAAEDWRKFDYRRRR